MATRLPTDLLRRSPQEASRLLALSYLDEIARAERRLADPEDAEALHDFRVGLRRLRSCLRAYRPALKGSVSKRIRRRLRELTLETNPIRDTEVHLAWLKSQASQLDPGEAEGLGWLCGRLEGRKAEVLDQARAKVARRFLKLETRLRKRLLTFEVEVGADKGREQTTFARVTSELIRHATAELSDSLKTVSRNDVTNAHETRISAKRLRYLLEPLSPRVPKVKGYVKRLKQLQNTLGELHDMQVMVETIPSTSGVAAIDGGLKALQRRAQQCADGSLAEFEDHWTPARAAGLLTRIDVVADSLPVVADRGPSRQDTSDAPGPLAGSLAGAPTPSLSLSPTLPLPFPLQPRQRLR